MSFLLHSHGQFVCVDSGIEMERRRRSTRSWTEMKSLLCLRAIVISLSCILILELGHRVLRHASRFGDADTRRPQRPINPLARAQAKKRKMQGSLRNNSTGASARPQANVTFASLTKSRFHPPSELSTNDDGAAYHHARASSAYAMGNGGQYDDNQSVSLSLRSLVQPSSKPPLYGSSQLLDRFSVSLRRKNSRDLEPSQ